MIPENSNINSILSSLSNDASSLQLKLSTIGDGNPWPQTITTPDIPTGVGDLNTKSKKQGFLPLGLISPSIDQINGDGAIAKNKVGDYIYYDWTGQRIEKRSGIDNLAANLSFLDTKTRFVASKDIPKNAETLKSEPYSTRDHYLIFGDTQTDYFKHGLQVIDGLSPIESKEFWESGGNSDARLSQFKNTPFENNDPIMFGFDIIIDDLSSPLLNGSIIDFINNYSGVSEIASRRNVYEDFKNQFVKFFKTRSTVSINESQTSMTRNSTTSVNLENDKNIYNRGKKAYLGYYLNGISGLDKLIEANRPDTKKFLVDYQKDVITLDFTEDVSSSVGALSHLYKLLYWSRVNGKGIIPENLLRFNCDIIISECRNFNRVRKGIDTGNLEIIKDNVSRYVYSLRECQFYFDKVPHEESIDMTNIKTFDKYTVTFDFKYSTTKFEKFVPTTDGFGAYVGYNGGSIWKIGNPGERENRGTQSGGSTVDSSSPRFYTINDNSLRQNGVEKPFIMGYASHNKPVEDIGGFAETIDESKVKNAEALKNAEKSSEMRSKSITEKLKNNILTRAKTEATDFYPRLYEKLRETAINSAKRELQTFINTRAALLNQTLNKIANSKGTGGNIYANPQVLAKNPLYRAPRNIYTDAPLSATDRLFYDVRGQLFDFVGDSLGRVIGGGSGLNRPI